MIRLYVLRALRLLLCATVVVAPLGCGPKQTRHTYAEINKTRGYDANNVAVIGLSAEPEVALRRPWGKVKGTFIGVGKGALEALNGTLEAADGSSGDVTVDLLVLTVIYTITGPVYMVEGGVSGARGGLPQAEIEASAAAMGLALEETDLQAIIKDRAARHLAEQESVFLIETRDAVPEGGYSSLRALGFDTVLELSVLEVGLEGGDGADPPLSFFMNTRARLIKTEINSVIFDRTFGYSKGSRAFRGWAMNDAQAFREEIDHALDSLASQAVMEAFDIHVTNTSIAPEDSKEIVSP